MMSEIGMVRLVLAVAIGFTAGAGIVGYYADRAVRALKGELDLMQRVVDSSIRTRGRL